MHAIVEDISVYQLLVTAVPNWTNRLPGQDPQMHMPAPKRLEPEVIFSQPVRVCARAKSSFSWLRYDMID